MRYSISKYFDKLVNYYIIGSFNLLLKRKSSYDNYWSRCREIMSDPTNFRISRVKNAGVCENNIMTMHNGLKVMMGEYAYSGDFGSIVLMMNKGVHEPQEEFLFSEILKYMPRDAVMLELGSNWAFYSMWFNSSVHGGRCWMVEPDDHCRQCGEQNFRINDLKGTFISGKVGSDGLGVDAFLSENGIQTLHLLHADVQGAEFDMLESCMGSLESKSIWYLFVSTHSQELHYKCMDLIQLAGYEIIAHADFDYGTFSFDGIMVAKAKEVAGPLNIELPLRKKNRRLINNRL